MEISEFAVDKGHGFVKFALRNGHGHIITGAFPSVATPYTESRIAGCFQNGESTRTRVFEVDGRKYQVNLDENVITGQSPAERNEANDFPTRPEYRALAGAAFAAAGITGASVVTMGLPVHTYAKYEQLVRETFTGDIDLGTSVIKVGRTVTLPQPAGTLVTAMARHGEQLGDTTVCILDFGHLSSDWLVTRGFAVDPIRSGGRPGGASHIYRSICEGIAAEIGEPFEDLDQVERAVRTGVPVRALGRPVAIDRHIEHAKTLAIDTVRAIRAKVRSVEDLTLVVTGGAAPLFHEAVSTVFPRNERIEMEGGRFTNVIGFLLYAEQRARRGTS